MFRWTKCQMCYTHHCHPRWTACSVQVTQMSKWLVKNNRGRDLVHDRPKVELSACIFTAFPCTIGLKAEAFTTIGAEHQNILHVLISTQKVPETTPNKVHENSSLYLVHWSWRWGQPAITKTSPGRETVTSKCVSHRAGKCTCLCKHTCPRCHHNSVPRTRWKARRWRHLLV